MRDTDVPMKTPAGQQEIGAKQRKLQPKVRSLLIMVHGADRNADHYFSTATAAGFLADALDNTNLTFTSAGGQPWTRQTTTRNAWSRATVSQGFRFTRWPPAPRGSSAW